ncbi:hypothetical protein TNCV_4345131 [Trichonephila clavipes]|nr:hypothetical protein TNCV_4345131 [Trichonephila clavipes]
MIIPDFSPTNKVCTPQQWSSNCVPQNPGVTINKLKKNYKCVCKMNSRSNWQRKRLLFCVKGRPSNERLADRPLCCKRHRIVRADTE